MLKTLPLLSTLTLLVAAPVLADPGPAAGWDHRGMQSHYQSADSAEHPLAPGERRIGRITIGAPATPSARVPDTLAGATQRQWLQRGSFADVPTNPAGGPAPQVQSSRHEGTPGAYTTPSR